MWDHFERGIKIDKLENWREWQAIVIISEVYKFLVKDQR